MYIHTKILLLLGLVVPCNLLLISVSIAATSETINSELIDVIRFGVVGDGIKDDTRSLQKALDYCSENNQGCQIPSGREVLITAPVYLWGNSGLYGGKASKIQISFNDYLDRYVLNLGLRRKMQNARPFSGTVANIEFQVKKGPLDKWDSDKEPISGRVIQLWNANDVEIVGNQFDIGPYFYGATAGHVNRHWSRKIGVRKNITIHNNSVRSKSDVHGMEGIGINYASGVTIANNSISGVGDDLVGVHFCDDVVVKGNRASGVDGRIFVSNSRNVQIYDNNLSREPSPQDGKYKKGVSLIYVGYEYPARVREPRPENIVIANNRIEYPEGAVDAGAAIIVRGAGSVKIEGNTIVNHSSSVTARGIWVAPWEDPDVKDRVSSQMTYPMKDVLISKNTMEGPRPLSIAQTGSCKAYEGFLRVENNDAKAGRRSCPDKAR